MGGFTAMRLQCAVRPESSKCARTPPSPCTSASERKPHHLPVLSNTVLQGQAPSKAKRRNKKGELPLTYPSGKRSSIHCKTKAQVSRGKTQAGTKVPDQLHPKLHRGNREPSRPHSSEGKTQRESPRPPPLPHT